MRKTIVAIVLFVGGVAAWWYTSPMWTLYQMKEAAQARDAGRLSKYIDYPAVREDLKGDFRRLLMKDMTSSPSPNGFEALGSTFALAFIGPMVDAMVTPEGVEAMFAHRSDPPVGSKTPALPKASSDPIIKRQGLSEFRVVDKDPAKATLLFQRHGLGWKLSGVDIPE